MEIKMQNAKVEETWKLIEDAINFEGLKLSNQELRELARRLRVKALSLELITKV
jgi:hypothetical protein